MHLFITSSIATHHQPLKQPLCHLYGGCPLVRGRVNKITIQPICLVPPLLGGCPLFRGPFILEVPLYIHMQVHSLLVGLPLI